ncbi:tyrosinase family protein [Nocardia sp. NPDC004278]
MADANGDMGENDTAVFDPIFCFHYCVIDYVFWVSHKRRGFTDRLSLRNTAYSGRARHGSGQQRRTECVDLRQRSARGFARSGSHERTAGRTRRRS